MNEKLTGNHIVILKSQMVLAAQEIEPLADDVLVRFRGTEIRVRVEEIVKIYATGKINQFPIDPGVLSTLATLEKGIADYEAAGGEQGRYTLCGASALALTIIPNRSTNDVDIVTAQPLDEFLSGKEEFHWDMEVEFMDEGLLRLMGDWGTRTSSAKGPMGREFRIMHPLDTMMQKMLRWDTERFEAKDMPDIDAIIEALHPSSETLRGMLCENPFRYAKASGPLAIATDAIESNTRLFLSRHLPSVSYESILVEASQKFAKKMERANLSLTPLNDVDLRTKITPVDMGMG